MKHFSACLHARLEISFRTREEILKTGKYPVSAVASLNRSDLQPPERKCWQERCSIWVWFVSMFQILLVAGSQSSIDLFPGREIKVFFLLRIWSGVVCSQFGKIGNEFGWLGGKKRWKIAFRSSFSYLVFRVETVERARRGGKKIRIHLCLCEQAAVSGATIRPGGISPRMRENQQTANCWPMKFLVFDS